MGGWGRGTPPPVRGRSPIPNSPSGWKLLDARNGEHMVSAVGEAGVRVDPSAPAGSGQAGWTLRPDAMEKETTA